MQWTYTNYVIPFLISAAFSLYLSANAWKRRQSSGALPIALLMLAAFIWSMGYAIELGSPDLPSKLFWIRFEYIGIPFLCLFWLATVLQYIGKGSILSNRFAPSLAAIPIATVVLAWTNSRHGLIYSQVWIDESWGLPTLGFVTGEWYWINVFYSYLLFLLACILLVRYILVSSSIYRMQAYMLLLAAVIPWAANVFYIAGESPLSKLDITPIAFTLSGVVSSIALFKFGLLDIMPIARHKVIEEMLDCLIVLDHQDRIVDMNPAAIKMLGTSKEQAIGNDMGMVPGTLKSLFSETSGVSEGEMSICQKAENGTVRAYFDMSISPILSKKGELKGRILLIRDVTLKRMASAAIRESEERLAQILKQMPFPVEIFDSNGSCLFVNRSFIESFCISDQSELNRDHPTGGRFPGVDSIMAELIGIACSGQTGHIPELEVFGQDFVEHGEEGSPNPVYEVAAFPVFRSSGELKEVVAIFMDITERKRMLDLLQRARMDAEAAAIAKAEFLANMSHEIRTPLNAVIGLTELLWDSKLNAEQQDYLRTIRTSGESLLSVINDILDFSKIDSGKLDLEKKPFSVRDAVSGAVSIVEAKADQKELLLSYRIDEAVPEFIIGDQGRLRQILVNLLGNAVKFTDKGSISVRVMLAKGSMIDEESMTAKESVPTKEGKLADQGIQKGINADNSIEPQGQDHCEVLFEVEDTGIGIPKDKQDLLFQKFSQVDASTTKSYGGTGLGLAISKRLVQLMGGKISVESVPGQGSTFRFTIKAEAAMASEHEAAEPAVEEIAGSTGSLAESEQQIVLTRTVERRKLTVRPESDIKILLVEDNPVNRKVAGSMLSRLGYHADYSINGIEAIEAFRQTIYDIVFMDVSMPEMDGLEASRRLRKAFGDGPWIIAMTAHALKGDKERCIDAGMNDYVSKPIQIDALRAAFDRYYRERG